MIHHYCNNPNDDDIYVPSSFGNGLGDLINLINGTLVYDDNYKKERINLYTYHRPEITKRGSNIEFIINYMLDNLDINTKVITTITRDELQLNLNNSRFIKLTNVYKMIPFIDNHRNTLHKRIITYSQKTGDDKHHKVIPTSYISTIIKMSKKYNFEPICIDYPMLINQAHTLLAQSQFFISSHSGLCEMSWLTLTPTWVYICPDKNLREYGSDCMSRYRGQGDKIYMNWFSNESDIEDIFIKYMDLGN